MSDWKDYGMGNPTDQEETMTAPITKDAEGNILKQYQDTQNDKQYASTPDTSTTSKNSATGSGIEAAFGTDYSWNTKAEERAGLDYEASVLETKSNYLTNRQEIESQGQQLQNQSAMQEYSQNQSNEKAGWTGGYILDTERQMNYLKQTIQSQMYGQMELQKYGYDTSLAAARLAYDTNKYDLALEYYNTALSRAVSEAEITGYYVSPETSEMLNEYSIASRIMNDETIPASDPEKIRADKVLASVYKWFEDNGISKQGVETLTHQDFINTLKATAQSLANFQENSDLLKIDINSFGEVDENGNLIYSDGYEKVNTVHFDKMSNEDIIFYANRGELAKQQVMGYFDGLIEKDIHSYLDTVTSTKDNKTTYNINEDNFKKLLSENSMKVISEICKTSETTFADYKLTTELNNKPIYFELKNGELIISIGSSPNKEDQSNNTTSNNSTIAPISDIETRVKNAYSWKEEEAYPITLQELSSAYTNLKDFKLKVQEDAIKDKADDDFDIDIGNYNYDLDVDWSYPTGATGFFAVNGYNKEGAGGEAGFNERRNKLKEIYPNPTENTLAIYKGDLWFYSTKLKKWGFVQKNGGGNRLKSDIETATKGSIPSRWE